MGIFDKLFGPPNVEELKSKKDVEGLIKALKYVKASELKDADVRKEAAVALGEIGDARAVEPLIQALKDETWAGVREKMIVALGEIGDARPVELLMQALKEGDSDAAWALGKIGDTKAVVPLIQALKAESDFVRMDAADALEKIGDARAVEPLIQALKDKVAGVRMHAADALVKIGDPAVEPLIQALKDKDSNVRMGAAEALGKIKDKRAIEPLIQALKDKVGDVGAYAAEALEKIGDARAVEPLIQALKDESVFVREDAAKALEKIGDARAIEPLIQALKDEDRYMAGNESIIENVLVKIGDKRCASVLIDKLFEYPRDLDSIDFLNFKNFFGKYTDLILKASGHSRSVYLTIGGEKDYTYSLAENKSAVMKLCEINSPTSSNILHKVAERSDSKVLSVSGHSGADQFYETLSFSSLREIAKKELKRRGNPPYNPSAYLDEEAWKL